MDTSPLEQKIAAIEQEIAEDQEKIRKLKEDLAFKIDLINDNISTNRKALKVYQKGLDKLKEKE